MAHRYRKLGAGTALLLLLAIAPVSAQSTSNSVEIRTEPETEVVWETVSLGRTDAGGSMTIEGMPAGSYAVVLRKRGHLDLEATLEVTIGANQVRLPLEREAPRVPDATAAMPDQEAASKPGDGTEAASVARPTARRESAAVLPVAVLDNTAADLSAPSDAAEVHDLASSPAAEAAPIWPSVPLLLAILVVVLVAGILLRRRSGPYNDALTEAATNPARHFVGERTIEVREDPDEFLANLKRQEEDIRHEESGTVVIDAEFVEVGDEDER